MRWSVKRPAPHRKERPSDAGDVQPDVGLGADGVRVWYGPNNQFLKFTGFNNSGWTGAVWDPLFVAPHAIAVDSQGDLYVGEVSFTESKVDRGARTIQKFARI